MPWGKGNAAVELKLIGDAAIPTLVALLEDRRPIRSVGYWRSFSPSRTVLRYQDAAAQILNEILPQPFYDRSTTGSYLSNEKPERRAKVIESIRKWCHAEYARPGVEEKWDAMLRHRWTIYGRSLMHSLADDLTQRRRLLDQLTCVADKVHPCHLPEISYLMCRLGDRSRLPEAADRFFGHRFALTTQRDSTASLSALRYGARQVVLYGNEEHRERFAELLRLPEQKYSALRTMAFRELVVLAAGRQRLIPNDYDKAEFPLHLLILCLDPSRELHRSTTHCGMRECDVAAAAVQAFTDRDFGFSDSGEVTSRDRAIERIREWWQRERPRR
jgi:hypothetical protein